MNQALANGGWRVLRPSYNLRHSRLAGIGARCCLPIIIGLISLIGPIGPITWTSAHGFGQNRAFTNDDVLKMVKAGFSETTILEAIRTNEPRFETSAEGLLALKNAGVSEKIITAMLTAARPKTGISGELGETNALPREIGVDVFKDDHYTDVTVEMANWRSKFFLPTSTTGNLTKSRLAARLDTPESGLQLSGKTEFLIVCPDGVSAMEYHLLRAEESKDKREFRVDFKVLNNGVLLALGGTGKSAMRFDAEKVAPGKFRIKISALEKGEYAFMPPGTVNHPGTSSISKMYTFGLR